MVLFIVIYPVYLVKRKQLGTKEGPVVYWVLVNVFGILAIILAVLQILAAYTQVQTNHRLQATRHPHA